MNVADLILASGEADQVALLHQNSRVTYGQLREQVGWVAAFLLAQGCAKGERIGIWSQNNPFFVATYFGIMRAGLVAVPFQTDLDEQGFGQISASAGIRRLFVSKRFAGRLVPWGRKHGVTCHVEEGGDMALRTSPTLLAPVPVDPGRDLAALMFTSGSTGRPKGVMVSHRNIECNTRDIVSYMELGRADRVMVVLPFHYCFGASLLHTHLMAGGTLVLNNDFKLLPEEMLLEMQRLECTGVAGVPSTYQILLRKSRFLQMQFPALRWFQQAGGKLPDPCIRELLNGFPGVRYFLMYGQTEATARLSYLPPERLQDKLGSIGVGLPSTRLDVLRPDGARVVPGSGDTGEIVASGDNITLGYWNDSEETGRFFKNGRLHTGDIARVDKDGFIFVVERERDMIKSGGNRVSAKEIEDVIAEVPEVVEVAVVGRAHELLGEAVVAFVVLAPGARVTPEILRIHCRKRLPAFKTPEQVVALAQMPHNGSGKVLKTQLRVWLSEGSVSPDHVFSRNGSRLVPVGT